MTAPVRIQEKNRGVWFEGLPDKLSEAVERYSLPDTDDWNVLDALSSATEFEGVEAYGNSAVIDGDQLVAPGTVYVKLQFDPSSEDPIIINDSFPARVFFTVDKNDKTDQKIVSVSRIDVDTSSFFD